MEPKGLLKRRVPLATLAAVGMLLIAVPAAEATFAGKPGRIAYASEAPGSDESSGNLVDHGFDIATVNPDGSDPRRLTGNGTEPDDEIAPSWSADGSLIAFVARHPFFPGPHNILADANIGVIGADGSARRVVPRSVGATPTNVDFLRDGRLYVTTFGADGIGQVDYTTGVDGAGAQSVPNSSLPASADPAVSPDGRLRVTTIGADLYLTRADGSQELLLASPGLAESEPVFSPDGTAIAYSARLPSSDFRLIVVMDLGTRDPRVIASGPDDNFAPDWGAIPVNCRGRRATIVGTEGKDKLVGTNGRDVIAGLGGRDRIKGKRGKDVLCGGKGKDRLSGNKGKDRLLGGKGKDRCVGGKGRDRAKGCEREKKI